MPDQGQENERLRLENEREKNQNEREKIRQQGENDRQTRSLSFWSMIFSTVMGLLTPILLTVYHVDTRIKVSEAKEQINNVEQAAKTAASTADQATRAVKIESAKLDEKVDANLAQWKAYNTKVPEDMNKAAEALAKAEKKENPPIIVIEAAKELP